MSAQRTRTANNRIKPVVLPITPCADKKLPALTSKESKKSQIIFKSIITYENTLVAAAGVEPATFALWEQYATTYTSLRYKTTYLHRPVAENKYPYIRNKSRRQERSRTSIHKVRAYCANHYTTYRKSCDFHKRQGKISICNKKHI